MDWGPRSYIYLTQQGASGTLVGTARLITCVAEVPFFHFSQALLRRCGLLGVLALSQAAYVRCWASGVL